MPRNGAALVGAGSFLAALALSVTTVADTATTPVLESFRDAFKAARALPLGSRPSPPDLEPTSLIHTSFATLSGYLGHSTRLNCDELLARPAETCESFTYGPGPALPAEDRRGSITISTGGPWLLVVGISNGRVVDSRWLGQK
jgi:hypothetical protein